MSLLMKRGSELDKMSLNSSSTFNRCEHDRSPTEDRIRAADRLR